MQAILENLWLGVISGLVATFLSLVIARIWKLIVEPWFEERIYKDAQIEGRWRSSGSFVFPETGEVQQSFIWNIRRAGHRVFGTIVCTSGPEDGKTYIFEGEFRNLLFTATYSSDSQSALERGTVSYMLVNNGNTLQGHCLYYCHLDHHQVRSCAETLVRDPMIGISHNVAAKGDQSGELALPITASPKTS